MLAGDSGKIATLPHTAESAKRKTPPPPVAKKPAGLTERIAAGKKSSNKSG